MKRSWIWAGFFALVSVAWLASGEIRLGAQQRPPAREARTAPAAKPAGEEPFKVEVITAHVTPRRAQLKLAAHTEASEAVMVRARTGGEVLETPGREGAAVRKGDVLCRLDEGPRPARLAAARAAAASARRDYEAGRKLFAGRHIPESRLKQLRALLDTALAQVRQYELDLSYTVIRAPISGILARQAAKRGDLLTPGAPCARIVALDPLKVIANASEREVGGIRAGQKATARLITGRELQGTISYIAPQADPATRTFRVELTARNPGGAARAQVTADLVIPLPARPAALVPLAAVILDDNGALGVHVAGPDGVVAFYPVKVLRETRRGAWVSGVPDGAKVIVSGQYYVLPGQRVKAVPFTPLKEKRS